MWRREQKKRSPFLPFRQVGRREGRSERTTTPEESKDRRKVFIIPLGDESGFYQVAAEVPP